MNKCEITKALINGKYEEQVKLTLDRKDIVNMVKGINPNFSVMCNPLVEKHGRFSGSQGDWRWHYGTFDKVSISDLLDIYILCKNSWEDK